MWCIHIQKVGYILFTIFIDITNQINWTEIEKVEIEKTGIKQGTLWFFIYTCKYSVSWLSDIL